MLVPSTSITAPERPSSLISSWPVFVSTMFMRSAIAYQPVAAFAGWSRAVSLASRAVCPSPPVWPGRGWEEYGLPFQTPIRRRSEVHATAGIWHPPPRPGARRVHHSAGHARRNLALEP